MSIITYVGQRIRQLRQSYGQTGISQTVLAKALHVTPNTISRWETGVYKPTIEDLERLAQFFQMPVNTFFPQPEMPNDPIINDLVGLVRDLSPDDQRELREYIEFRRARQLGRRDLG